MNSPKSFNPWPLTIIGFFVVFISAAIVFIIFACSQSMDLVAADYYQQEIQYQGRIDSIQRARNVGANVRYDPAAEEIMIALPAGHAEQNPTGKIKFYRPSAAHLDQELKLQVDSTGVQSVPAKPLQSGLWKVQVSWQVNGQHYFCEQTIVLKAIAPGHK